MKPIIKTAFKILLLFGILQSVFWGIGYLYPLTIHTNLPQELGYKYINRVTSNKLVNFSNRILVIGDSSAATAIHTKELGDDVMTLGVWGSSPAELYLYTKAYLTKYNAPKCILLTHVLSPDYYQDHSFWELVVPYSNISLEDYLKIYDKSKELNHFPGNAYNKFTFIFKILTTKYHLFFATPFIYLEKLKFKNKDQDVIAKIDKFFQITRGEYVRLVHGSDARGDWWDFLANPMPQNNYYEYYFNLIMQEAQKHNIKIYFFTPPVSKKLNFLYSDRMNQLSAFYQTQATKYPHAKFLDIKQFYPIGHYIDDAHLNYYGAHKFTQKIAPELECQ